MRFIVFGDIHLGTYEGSVLDETGLNGRLIDGLNVWDEISKYAVDNNIKTIAFLGDRFRSSNPKGYIRDLADEKLKMFGINFDFLCLVGNHDYYEKSSFYHSFGVAHIFKENLSRLFLLDNPGNVVLEDVVFWGLPFGRKMEEFDFTDFDENYYNILLFHDEVVGAKYSNGVVCRKGLNVDDLKRFDLVLGGHIHLSQEITGCKGGFVGSVTQLKKDDAAYTRGWWDITIENRQLNIRKIESNAPKYILQEIKIDKGDEYKVFFQDDWLKILKGNYLILKATGNKTILYNLNRKEIERELIDKCNLRFCTFELDMKKTYEFKIPELQKCKDVSYEIEIILDKLDLQNLKKEDLRAVGLKINNEVDKL